MANVYKKGDAVITVGDDVGQYMCTETDENGTEWILLEVDNFQCQLKINSVFCKPYTNETTMRKASIL